VNPAIECEGAPRDLGRDQGHACGALLRERFGALPLGARVRLRLALRGGPERALGRELARHFPREAEWLSALASAARVPPAWLAVCLARESQASPAELAAAAGREITGAGALVGRALAGEWIARRSRPEGAFRSVEVARPWLAHPLLGVNEAGLAVAVVGGGPARELRGGGAPASGCLPASALALDCLQRFAALEACLEWCAGRPGERPAMLLFADSRGEVGGIEIGPGERRILRPAEGWLAVGGGPEERERIGKALRGRRRFGAGLALADPAAHSLRIGAARYEI
jgi:hypothetical protein